MWGSGAFPSEPARVSSSTALAGDELQHTLGTPGLALTELPQGLAMLRSATTAAERAPCPAPGCTIRRTEELSRIQHHSPTGAASASTKNPPLHHCHHPQLWSLRALTHLAHPEQLSGQGSLLSVQPGPGAEGAQHCCELHWRGSRATARGAPAPQGTCHGFTPDLTPLAHLM